MAHEAVEAVDTSAAGETGESDDKLDEFVPNKQVASAKGGEEEEAVTAVERKGNRAHD
ncbi:MAG: hypothetical protein Q9157_005157 [Trypethelium eluteriae]